MISPLDNWWRAVRAADSSIDFDTFVGLSAAPANLSICHPSCDCRLDFALERAARKAVHECGYRILANSADEGCERGIRRNREPRGTKGQRTTRLLLEWTAATFRPETCGGCRTGGPLMTHAGGLAAYSLWEDRLGRSTVSDGARRAHIWREVRVRGAHWLNSVAGSRRVRQANLLRRAAERISDEAEVVLREPGRPQPAEAGRAAQQAAWEIAEAALGRAGLPVAAIIALLEIGGAPLAGVALNEVHYLARAGIRPLRELAAVRLSASDNPQSVAALGQLLFDPDGCVALSALWSIEQVRPPRLSGLLLNALRNGDRIRAALDYPFSRSLAAVCARSGDPATAALIDLRNDLAEEDSDSPLAGDIDLVLSAVSQSQA